MIKEIDERIAEIDKEIEEIMASDLVDEAKVYVLKRERHDLIHMCKNLNSHDKVYLARHKKRPKITEYVDAIFDDFFEQKGINLYIDNNSNASVVAEKYNMYNPDSTNYKYRNKKNMMILYLGAGTGAGLIFNNALYHGATNLAGEVGHIELPPYPNQNFKAIEPCCSCGSCECLDYRIRNDVFEMTKKEFSELSSKEIKDYLINHPEKFEIFTYYIGKIINLLVNLLNPDLIIFTGKFKEVADYMWPLLYKQIATNKLSYIANACEFKTSNLGATSPAIGIAICAYFDKIGEAIDWQF